MMTVTIAKRAIDPQTAPSPEAEENIFADTRSEETRRSNNDPRHKQPKPNNQPRRAFPSDGAFGETLRFVRTKTGTEAVP